MNTLTFCSSCLQPMNAGIPRVLPHLSYTRSGTGAGQTGQGLAMLLRPSCCRCCHLLPPAPLLPLPLPAWGTRPVNCGPQFYWDVAPPVCLGIICGCSGAAAEELNTCFQTCASHHLPSAEREYLSWPGTQSSPTTGLNQRSWRPVHWKLSKYLPNASKFLVLETTK